MLFVVFIASVIPTKHEDMQTGGQACPYRHVLE